MNSQQDVLTATKLIREFQTPDGELEVLKGISLAVKQSEMVAVTGESGVGKSTLLHILGGLDQPTSGEVVVAGESFNNKTEEELAKFRNKKIGFVFQAHYLLSDFNAIENMMMPMLIGGMSQEDAQNKGEQLLALVGLSDRGKHLPSQLSGGEQQRVAVGRALANDPTIVLADEPSGNLDTKNGSKLHELLLEINEKNKTAFVIATHNRELAKSCHRELVMTSGIFEN